MSKVSTNAARSFIHRTPRRENNTVVTVQNNFSKMFLHGNQIACGMSKMAVPPCLCADGVR